jgi:molecular chaperone DnaK (HSP70)
MTVVGIDLGTTYFSVAYIIAARNAAFDELTSTCIEVDQPTTEGTFTSPLVASVVALQDGKHDFLGEGAKRILERSAKAALIPERSIFYNTKNEMGIKKLTEVLQSRTNSHTRSPVTFWNS